VKLRHRSDARLQMVHGRGDRDRRRRTAPPDSQRSVQPRRVTPQSRSTSSVRRWPRNKIGASATRSDLPFQLQPEPLLCPMWRTSQFREMPRSQSSVPRRTPGQNYRIIGMKVFERGHTDYRRLLNRAFPRPVPTVITPQCSTSCMKGASLRRGPKPTASDRPSR
jgi:hypothetical protein